MTVLISAHKAGSRETGQVENTRAALRAACTTATEYLEFDVQRLAGGDLVLFHNSHVEIGGRRIAVAELSLATFVEHLGEPLAYQDALQILHDADVKAHLDLKFAGVAGGRAEQIPEVQAVAMAVNTLGVGNVAVTTLEDSSVKAIRAWSATAHPELLVGLSLGRSIQGLNPWQAAKLKLSELFPGRRFRSCGANLVVVDHRLARLTVARWARRHQLPVLVWTVDKPKDVRRWLSRTDVWMITTNYPAAALLVRQQLSPSAR